MGIKEDIRKELSKGTNVAVSDPVEIADGVWVMPINIDSGDSLAKPLDKPEDQN